MELGRERHRRPRVDVRRAVTASSSFRQEYEAELIDELPRESIRYFPEASSTRAMLVRFSLMDGSSWVGGFAEGALAKRACSGVFASPSARHACVVANGCAYTVDVEHPEKTLVIVEELVTQVMPAPAASLLLLADPWQVYACSAEQLAAGSKWASPRLAIDGLKIIAADAWTAVVLVEQEELTIALPRGP